VEAARASWCRGHPLLRAIAIACRSRRGSAWDKHVTRSVFGDRYYARALRRPVSHDLKYFLIERRWRDEKRQALPQYFDAWGVPSAKRIMDDKLKLLKFDSYCVEHRAPTPAERDCLAIVNRAIRMLCPEFAAILKRNRVSVAVGPTRVMAGRLQECLRTRRYEVFLAERVFRLDFAQALSIFLHEHAHIFGTDESREFTDALTYLLQSIVQHRAELDAFESAWLSARSGSSAEPVR